MPETKVPERIPCIEDIVQFGSLNGELNVSSCTGARAPLYQHIFKVV